MNMYWYNTYVNKKTSHAELFENSKLLPRTYLKKSSVTPTKGNYHMKTNKKHNRFLPPVDLFLESIRSAQ